MRLKEGDNHLISERDGLAICQIWTRPDLSAEQGAKNAQEMVAFIQDVVLRAGTQYRGIIFDVRRGPPVFGPKTRETLAALLVHSIARNVRVAILCGGSATQVLQFRSLCAPPPRSPKCSMARPRPCNGCVSRSRPSADSEAARLTAMVMRCSRSRYAN
jgi:hypothetical protein